MFAAFQLMSQDKVKQSCLHKFSYYIRVASVTGGITTKRDLFPFLFRLQHIHKVKTVNCQLCCRLMAVAIEDTEADTTNSTWYCGTYFLT